MEKDYHLAEEKKSSTGVSIKKIMSALALAGVLVFPQNNKAQNTKNEDQNIHYTKQINIQQDTDSMKMQVLLEWFEFNTFINVKVISREKYTELQYNNLIEGGDGEKILHMPEDLRPEEFETIIQKLNQKTFGSDSSEYDALAKIRKMRDGDKEGYYQMLLESVFEYGTDSLSNINNLRDNFIAKNQELHDKMIINKEQGNTKKTTRIQKEIAGNIVHYIHNFGWKKTRDNPYDMVVANRKSIPTKAIEEHVSNCITKSIIAYKLLKYYGIQVWGCYSANHQAIKIELEDGSKYYVDAEKFDKIIPRKENEEEYTPHYKSIDTPLGPIYTITQDTETMIMANMLYNHALVSKYQAKQEKDTTKKREYFEKADFYLHIALDFSDLIPLFRKIGAEIYYYRGREIKDQSIRDAMYTKALQYVERAIMLEKENIGFWELKAEILRYMGNTEASKKAHEKFRELMINAGKKRK